MMQKKNRSTPTAPSPPILLPNHISLLSLINISSGTVAFNAIVSLGTATLFSTYFISIACVVGRPLFYFFKLLAAIHTLARVKKNDTMNWRAWFSTPRRWYYAGWGFI